MTRRLFGVALLAATLIIAVLIAIGVDFCMKEIGRWIIKLIH